MLQQIDLNPHQIKVIKEEYNAYITGQHKEIHSLVQLTVQRLNKIIHPDLTASQVWEVINATTDN